MYLHQRFERLLGSSQAVLALREKHCYRSPKLNLNKTLTVELTWLQTLVAPN